MTKLLVFPSTLICMLAIEWFAFVQSGLFGKLMDATIWAAVAGVQDAVASVGMLAYLIGVGVVGAYAIIVMAVVSFFIYIAFFVAKAIAETLP